MSVHYWPGKIIIIRFEHIEVEEKCEEYKYVAAHSKSHSTYIDLGTRLDNHTMDVKMNLAQTLPCQHDVTQMGYLEWITIYNSFHSPDISNLSIIKIYPSELIIYWLKPRVMIADISWAQFIITNLPNADITMPVVRKTATS